MTGITVRRLRVLAVVARAGRASPSMVARELQVTVVQAANDVRALYMLGLLAQRETRSGSTAVEHFYEVTPEARVRVDELASAARRAQEALRPAAAVDEPGES